MADYQVQRGDVGVHAQRLVAGQIDTVTFVGASLADIEVLSDGLADIYITFGADSTPTIAGQHCWRVPAFPCSTVFPSRLWLKPTGANSSTVVKLLSSGTPEYSVSRSR